MAEQSLSPGEKTLPVAVTSYFIDLPSHRGKTHNDVIKWKHFPRYWSFVRGIHRSPVNSPHKGQWRGALMFSLSCAWTNGWVNNRDAGDIRRHRVHHDVTVMESQYSHRRTHEDDGIPGLDKFHLSFQPHTAGVGHVVIWWTNRINIK